MWTKCGFILIHQRWMRRREWIGEEKARCAYRSISLWPHCSKREAMPITGRDLPWERDHWRGWDIFWVYSSLIKIGELLCGVYRPQRCVYCDIKLVLSKKVVFFTTYETICRLLLNYVLFLKFSSFSVRSVWIWPMNADHYQQLKKGLFYHWYFSG